MGAGKEISIVIDQRESVSPSPPPPSPPPPPPPPTAIAVQYWLSSILSEPEQILRNHKIQEVPQMLRLIKSSANCYDPKFVSIGPLHHGKEELKAAEKFKGQLTRDFVESCRNKLATGLNKGVEEVATELYKEVEKVAWKARLFYDDCTTRGFNDTAFTQLMFLDGCFLLQFIHYRVHEEENKMNLKRHDIALVHRDLFLLENQLPFKVLKVLMNLRYGTGVQSRQLLRRFLESSYSKMMEMMESTPPDSFLEMMGHHAKLLARAMRSKPTGSADQNINEAEPAVHLLQLARAMRSKPTGSADQNINEAEPAVHLLQLMRRQLINPKAFAFNDGKYSYRSVQQLKTAGIRFRPNKLAFFLSDVRYERNGILRLPPVTLDDSTKSLFLNLVAYEMCPGGPNNDSGVASYLCFIDSLIDRPEDVKELRQRGILLNCPGSDEEVADLFRDITRDLVPNPHAYTDVMEEIEKVFKNNACLLLRKWVTESLTFLAFLGGFLVLVLTFIQTLYAVAVPEGWIK